MHDARLVAVAMIPVAMIPVAAASVIGQFATHRNLTLMCEPGRSRAYGKIMGSGVKPGPP